MDNKSKMKSNSNLEQLKKYAKDLSEVYKSEKKKRGELKAAHKQLLKYAESLNKTNMELEERNKEISEAYLDTIHRLVLAAEYKDQETGDHIMRISRYSALIAEKLGLSARDVQNIHQASPMHDVGKVGIPDQILMKPSKLTEEEFEIMKEHAAIGAKILDGSKAEILQMAQQIALSHHEKWNGKGYPRGLSDDEIPLEGRIVGLVEAFDVITSRRPYKDPYPVEVACGIIEKERGQQFDPKIVDIFLKNIDEIVKIKKEINISDEVTVTDFNWSERDRVDGKYI